MKRRILNIALIISIMLLSCESKLLAAFSQTGTEAAKIARFLDESGYSYSKVSGNVWTILFRGKALSDFNVIASTHEELLILFVIVAEKKQMRVTPEMAQKLLSLNESLDRVKVGIDKDGDLFVRVDLSARVLDTKEFKINVEQVAAASDEVFLAVKANITPAK